MADLTTLETKMLADVATVDLNCAELLDANKDKTTFELETTEKKSFGEENRDEGSG